MSADHPAAGASLTLEELAADIARAKAPRHAGEQAEVRWILMLVSASAEVMLGPIAQRAA